MKGCAARLRTGSVDGVNGSGQRIPLGSTCLRASPQVSALTQRLHIPTSGFDSRHLHPEVFVDCASTLRRLHEARPLLGSGLVVCPPLTALVSGEVTAGLVFVDAPELEPCDLAPRHAVRWSSDGHHRSPDRRREVQDGSARRLRAVASCRCGTAAVPAAQREQGQLHRPPSRPSSKPYSTQSSDTKRMSQLRALAAANPPVEQAPLRACDPGEPGYTWGLSPVD